MVKASSIATRALKAIIVTASGCMVPFIMTATCGCGPQLESAASPQSTSYPTTHDNSVNRPNPSYSSVQLRLLQSQNVTIETPATSVFPSPVRFTYAEDRAIVVPDDVLQYARLVSKTIEQSSLTYVFRSVAEEALPSVSNTSALFGSKPHSEPDPWIRVMIDEDGIARTVATTPPNGVYEVLQRAAMTLADATQPTAQTVQELEGVVRNVRNVPAIYAMLADAALRDRNLKSAEEACSQALAIDRRSAHCLRVMAEVYVAQNKMQEAVDAIAQALAVYPTYPRVKQLAQTITGKSIDDRTRVLQPFIDVTIDGAVVVATCERPFCKGYATCKAAMRYETGFRQALLQSPEDTQYHLSTTEEFVCLQAGLGAYLDKRQQHPEQTAKDPLAEHLLDLAKTQGLAAYAMFDIIGQYRPDWLRITPRVLFEQIVMHVKHNVLLPGSNKQDKPKPVHDQGVVEGVPTTVQRPGVVMPRG